MSKAVFIAELIFVFAIFGLILWLVSALFSTCSETGGVWNSLTGSCDLPEIPITEKEVCYLPLAMHLPTAEDCYITAENSFNEVCNEVLHDNEFCWQIWDRTELSYDPIEKKCYMEIPIACEYYEV